jgi:hypothetical protein
MLFRILAFSVCGILVGVSHMFEYFKL